MSPLKMHRSRRIDFSFVLQVKDSSADGGLQHMEERCDLLVSCDAPDINPNLFQCINGSGLVYDGRLVVDTRFRTNDPRILAGGTIAKFSRRVADNTLLENFNSEEVGQRLASSLMGLLTGDSACLAAPPDMTMPKVAGCTLPGNCFFMFAGVPEAMKKPSLQPPEVPKWTV